MVDFDRRASYLSIIFESLYYWSATSSNRYVLLATYSLFDIVWSLEKSREMSRRIGMDSSHAFSLMRHDNKKGYRGDENDPTCVYLDRPRASDTRLLFNERDIDKGT